MSALKRDVIMDKKPDNVVWSEEDGYNASLLPYATNVGSPKIEVKDITAFKRTGVDKVKKDINAKFNEIKREYEKLIEQARISELVYKSKFNFEPIVGDVYHLYLNTNGESFLSLIGPNEWNMEHMGSFRLLTNFQWEIISKK